MNTRGAEEIVTTLVSVISQMLFHARLTIGANSIPSSAPDKQQKWPVLQHVVKLWLLVAGTYASQVDLLHVLRA
jgi:hypothetical protein